MNKTINKVCMITGVGDGTGAYTARKFAKSGYKIAMIARDSERLSNLENELPNSKGYTCDVSDLEKLQDVCKKVKKEMGPPEILIHNAVKGNFEKLLDGKAEWLEENFDELWENELAQFTQECIVESFEGQDLTEEQVQQLDEVLGLGLAAKGIMKAAPIVSKGLRKANVGIKKGLRAVGRKVGGATKAIGTGIKDTARGAVSVGKSALKKVGGAIKKAAPIIGKGALLGTGAAPVSYTHLTLPTNLRV